MIKMTKPELPTSIDQWFVNADVEILALTDDAVIAFCEVPRMRCEVAERTR